MTLSRSTATEAKFSATANTIGCAVSSIMEFAQDVALSCDGDCVVDVLDAHVPARGSVNFSVLVAPSQTTPIRIAGKADGPIKLTRSVIVGKEDSE